MIGCYSTYVQSSHEPVTYNHMVVDTSEQHVTELEIDRLFHALADATRRDIVRLTLQGELSVSGLADRFPMSFAAVQKHVAVLERSGLVTKQRRGREQLVHGNVDTIRRANRLLEQFELLWRDRLDRFADVLSDTLPNIQTNPQEKAHP